MSKGRERDHAAGRGADEHALECVRTLLKLRGHFHDHVVLIDGLIDGRNKALSKGVVEYVVDVLRRHAQPGGGIAIDHQAGFEALVLLVRIHIAQFWQCPQFLQ